MVVIILCLGTFLLVSCEENGKKEFPVVIPFDDYSLAGTSCQWRDFSDVDTLIIINSTEELGNYVNCTDNYPEIDFSKHTLLLAHGLETSSLIAKCEVLQQISEKSYKIKVSILPTDLTVMTYWHVPIIINKLDDDSTIDLVIIIKDPFEE